MSTSELKIEIGGQEITPLSATIKKTMDTGVDIWGAPVAWTPGANPAIDKIALPFKYPLSKVYIDDELQITGYMYNPQPSLRTDGQMLNFVGASKTANAIDSTAHPSSTFSKDASLKSRAIELLEPLGLKAEFETDTGGTFADGMTIEPTEKIFDHLLKYASQRGILVSNTKYGYMLFWKAITSGEPVASIEENPDFKAATSATEYAASYDGRKAYGSYRAFRDTPGSSDALRAIFGKEEIKSAVAEDDNIAIWFSRFLTFQVNETTSGDIQKAANWARSAVYAEALKQTINVPGWRIPGKGSAVDSLASFIPVSLFGDSDDKPSPIWEVNTLVSVKSPTLMLPNGYIFLIREVEFLLDKGAQSTNLSLVPPQVYSGEPIDYPWSIAGEDNGLSGLAGLAADLLGF